MFEVEANKIQVLGEDLHEKQVNFENGIHFRKGKYNFRIVKKISQGLKFIPNFTKNWEKVELIHFLSFEKILKFIEKELLWDKNKKCIKLSRNIETRLQKFWCVLKWGYLSSVTLHICNLQEANNSATGGMRDSQILEKEKLHY